ncbi:MAG: (d)CMP kinase [Desulfoprunum sp.]|uniref:(d)CMP kinase n=1 Tax=Desulfoprunum sp. TaxID=2020866 RepID=UPI00052DE748|nr:cytidylate kinase [Desulfobulbus sp. Tol-SR]
MIESQAVIAIDGPSGVGKSTISRKIARALGFTYLDTGAMYRAVGLFLQWNRIDLCDDQAMRTSLAKIQIQLLPGKNEDDDTGVLLNGEDVSGAIRTPEMAMIASKVSANPLVREKLTALQRELGNSGGVVAEGRDTGTVVFPRARFKFFLDARPEERARRRVRQLRMRGETADEQEILEMTLLRDKNDRERAIAPLRQAEDARIIDTTSRSIDEVARLVLEVVLEERTETTDPREDHIQPAG